MSWLALQNWNRWLGVSGLALGQKIPPAADVAPPPTWPRSSRATWRPDWANRQATEQPIMPPPTTIAS